MRLAAAFGLLLLAGCAGLPGAAPDACALPEPLILGGSQALQVHVVNDANVEENVCVVVSDAEGVVWYGQLDLERRDVEPNVRGQSTVGIEGRAFDAEVWLASSPEARGVVSFAAAPEHHLVVLVASGPAIELSHETREPTFE